MPVRQMKIKICSEFVTCIYSSFSHSSNDKVTLFKKIETKTIQPFEIIIK